MKKLIQLVFFLLVFGDTYAQNTFAPVGAEWWYYSNSKNFDYWAPRKDLADRLQSVKDTVVLGIPCRKMLATEYIRLDTSPDELTVRRTDSFFLYNNDDTVFVYDRSIANFTPLYIFNVEESDTVCIRIPSSELPIWYDTAYSFCYVVDSIRMEMYDTALLRSVYTHALDGNPDPVFMAFNWGTRIDGPEGDVIIGKYTERIGGNWPIYGGLFPSLSLAITDYAGSTFPQGTFRCYTDSSVAINMEGGDCDYIPVSFLSINTVTLKQAGIQVYPNPSKGAVTIQSKTPFTKDTRIHVMDMSGKTVEIISGMDQREHISLDLSALMPGMYLLQFQLKEGNFYHKLVLTH